MVAATADADGARAQAAASAAAELLARTSAAAAASAAAAQAREKLGALSTELAALVSALGDEVTHGSPVSCMSPLCPLFYLCPLCPICGLYAASFRLAARAGAAPFASTVCNMSVAVAFARTRVLTAAERRLAACQRACARVIRQSLALTTLECIPPTCLPACLPVTLLSCISLCACAHAQRKIATGARESWRRGCKRRRRRCCTPPQRVRLPTRLLRRPPVFTTSSMR